MNKKITQEELLQIMHRDAVAKSTIELLDSEKRMYLTMLLRKYKLEGPHKLNENGEFIPIKETELPNFNNEEEQKNGSNKNE